jgi:CHAT domain-containing protein
MKPAGGSYLVEQYEIVQFTSPRELLTQSSTGNTKHATSPSLLMGDPEFGVVVSQRPAQPDSRGNRGASLRDVFFRQLPGSLEETQRISAILEPKYPTVLLTGSKATKSALKSAKSPTFLHLATHGFYLDEPAKDTGLADPVDALARSGLALANANLVAQGRQTSLGNEGILTALEAISLDLNGTRLVALSACETGVGLVEPGEGVHGLARAFLEAGAQAVIATLWPIADEATSTFMQHFYGRLVRGEKAQSALQHTQVEFMHDPVLQDPLYWAPFILIGQ